MTRHATTRPLREGAIMDVPRAHRRLQLREVARRRKSGDWGEWVTLPVDRGIGSEDWLLEIRMIWRNQVFAVLGRPVEGALHLAIANGCTCPVIDNARGKGVYGDGDRYGWWVSADCPLHGEDKATGDAPD